MTGGFTAPQIDWAQLAPIIIVLGAGVVGVLVEAFVPRGVRRTVQLAIALVATAGALIAVSALWAGVAETGGTAVVGGSVMIDGPALVIQGIVAGLTLIALLVVADRTETGENAFAPSAAAVPGSDYELLSRRAGLEQTEVFPLVLFAAGGMMIFPAAGDLLTMFVALEVLSLPLYLLSGLARRRRLLSQEAAMKYFLLGAFASAFFLFGVALLYGFAGSVRLDAIAAATTTVVGLDPLLLTGVAMVLVGLLFKIGAVPFHSWTPDVYQGAPTPITGFMAACTKVAAFGALLRFLYVGVAGARWDYEPVLWTVAIATMVVGSVLAITQTDIKRLLAYSSIAHAGFILTGVLAFDRTGLSGAMFYLVAYGFTTIGAFAVVTLVRDSAGEATHLSQWAGLARRSPLVAGTFALFLLAFAGIPLTSGFTGKYAVFSAAIANGGTWLAVVGVLSSAIAAFFYVRVIVLMYFSEPDGDAVSIATPSAYTIIAIGIGASVTLLLGVLPSPLLELAGRSALFLP